MPSFTSRPLYSRPRVPRPMRPRTLSLSPSGGEGIETAPSREGGACVHATFCLGHDGGIDAEHGIAADGARAEARREDAHRARDDTLLHRVVQGDRDARRRGIADAPDVEVEALGRNARGL